VIDIEASIERAGEQRFDVRQIGPMTKTEEDVARYRHVIEMVRPNLLIETGSWNGNSARWFARRVPKVVTIDVNPIMGEARPGRIVIERTGWELPQLTSEYVGPGSVVFLQGSSTDEAIVDGVHSFAGIGQGPVMVVLDSDHDGVHVLAELQAYAELVTVGSYLVVEDTLVHWMGPERWGWKASPLDAVAVFMADHPGMFVVDEEVEELSPTSQMPGGWLRRVGFKKPRF
jgi:cephalosporin hydroxylase